jgi:hypothetical protein
VGTGAGVGSGAGVEAGGSGVEVESLTGAGGGVTTMVVVGTKGPLAQTVCWKALYCAASLGMHVVAMLAATPRVMSSLHMQRKSEGLQALFARDSKTMVW